MKNFCQMWMCAWIVLFAVGFFSFSFDIFDLRVRAVSLNNLTQGDIIQITPKSGTYMCNNNNCSGNGTAAEPYKLMYTGMSDTNSAYFVMVDNYCAWRSADCTYAYNGTTTKYRYATSFNSNSANTTFNNDLGGGRQSQHILIQLDNFYNSLPDQVGGINKAAAIPAKTFDLAAITSNYGTGPATKGACSTTTNTTSYGNINATFDGSTCSMTSKISLLSYEEWQGGLYARGYYPTSGSIGNAFCQSRFGTDCSNAGSYGLFNKFTIAKSPHHPWFRSPIASNTLDVWAILSDSSASSVNYNNAHSSHGLSPTLWLSSNISTMGGAGTYAEPYYLSYCDDPANQNKLDCLEIGTAIQITGQGGAEYKFIKLIPRDDDGNVMTHSNGSAGSYWMLADNYCGLANAPTSCDNGDYQTWNPTSDGTRYNNWTTMASTQYSVYQQVLTPFYNDLPTNIAGMSKDSAILTKAYPMSSITAASGTGTTTKSSCYLTVGSAGTGIADPTACTWTDKISLPSYTDWQNGLNAFGYYSPSGSNAYAYSMTRFGTAWDSSNKFDAWWPWLRSPYASNANYVWHVNGSYSTHSVGTSHTNNDLGVSPTLWLSSEIILDGTGTGTYADPYNLNSALSQNYVSLSAPTASWNNSTQVLNVTGIVGYPVSGQSVLLWATACNTAGQCKQKSTTVIITNNGFQAYNLDWQASELPAGEFDGTIWVGAHVIASPGNEANAFNQSNSVDFTISPRTMDLSVTKNRAFNLNLGDAAIFNLTPGTNQGVTVSVDSTTNNLSISGTLTQDTQVTFGSVTLNFQTYEIPQSVVLSDSLSLQ